MSDQLQEALKRAWLTLAAIIAAGLVPLIPDLIAQTRPTVQDMMYVFIGGAAGGFVKRFLGEGIYDGRRAATGNTIAADVTRTPTP